jgi:hypothetical protein
VQPGDPHCDSRTMDIHVRDSSVAYKEVQKEGTVNCGRCAAETSHLAE